jgi:outer membrane protein OmpA-like peptidoglycan-associated protein
MRFANSLPVWVLTRNEITTKSFGKERPAMRGASPETWAKNRRTVIRIRGE